MNKNKPVKKEVEETLACTAFAEAGEPCPLGVGDKKTAAAGQATKPGIKKAPKPGTVEDTLACTAFAEAGEPCPLPTQKAAKKKQ